MSTKLEQKEKMGGFGFSLEGLDDVMFDTVTVPPTGGFARLFCVVVGADKSEIKTNMYLPNALPNPRSLRSPAFMPLFSIKMGWCQSPTRSTGKAASGSRWGT